MGYVPPQLRNNPFYSPRKLTLKTKPQVQLEQACKKTKHEVYEDHRKTNYGKADAAWSDL